MRERRLPAVSARPTRPLRMPSWSQRGCPRIRRMMAAQPPATTVGPMPNGMINAPLPDRAQPLPEIFERLSTIVRTQRRPPAMMPRRAMSPVNPGSRFGSVSGGAIRACYRSLFRSTTCSALLGPKQREDFRSEPFDRLVVVWSWSHRDHLREAQVQVISDAFGDIVGRPGDRLAGRARKVRASDTIAFANRLEPSLDLRGAVADDKREADGPRNRLRIATDLPAMLVEDGALPGKCLGRAIGIPQIGVPRDDAECHRFATAADHNR